MFGKSYFHGRPHPKETISKFVYLLVDFYLVFIGCGLPYFGQYLSLMCNFDHTGTPIAADQAF